MWSHDFSDEQECDRTFNCVNKIVICAWKLCFWARTRVWYRVQARKFWDHVQTKTPIFLDNHRENPAEIPVLDTSASRGKTKKPLGCGGLSWPPNAQTKQVNLPEKFTSKIVLPVISDSLPVSCRGCRYCTLRIQLAIDKKSYGTVDFCANGDKIWILKSYSALDFFRIQHEQNPTVLYIMNSTWQKLLRYCRFLCIQTNICTRGSSN